MDEEEAAHRDSSCRPSTRGGYMHGLDCGGLRLKWVWMPRRGRTSGPTPTRSWLALERRGGETKASVRVGLQRGQPGGTRRHGAPPVDGRHARPRVHLEVDDRVAHYERPLLGPSSFFRRGKIGPTKVAPGPRNPCLRRPRTSTAEKDRSTRRVRRRPHRRMPPRRRPRWRR